GICGKNGIGKTNILDAIFFLCFTKSAFNHSDSVSVKNGTNGFRLTGNFRLFDQKEEAILILRENNKKELSINNSVYPKLSQHIGHYPCILIAPDDSVLITGRSEERRSFIDALLSQINEQYLKNLIHYNKIIQQRNSLLKQFAQTGQINETVLAVIDEQLIPLGDAIYNTRAQFLIQFLPKVKNIYNELADKDEAVSITYESHLHHDHFSNILIQNKQKDFALQRTIAGIHRDDLSFLYHNQNFKNIASQGQRKTLLFALKLAEIEVIESVKKFSPIILLDDIFEKLDENRIQKLLSFICTKNSGQVFITDTQKDRLSSKLSFLKEDLLIIET
ncbi:MAG: DNA replication and repair protein RecF, partial [Bacteroidia bacterium]